MSQVLKFKLVYLDMLPKTNASMILAVGHIITLVILADGATVLGMSRRVVYFSA